MSEFWQGFLCGGVVVAFLMTIATIICGMWKWEGKP